MDNRHLLLLCLLSALQVPNIANGLNIYAGAEGGSGRIECYLPLTGKYKYFCKGSCTEGRILLKTDERTTKSGPYSLSFELGTGKNYGQGILTVRINSLTAEDSGHYVCALGNSQQVFSHLEFEVMVTDVLPRTEDRFIRAETEGGNITISCHRPGFRDGSKRFFCRGECDKEEDVLIESGEEHAERGRYSIEYKKDSVFGLYITIRHLDMSDQGRYKCGYGSALSPDWVASRTIIVVVAPSPTTAMATNMWTTMMVATTTQTAMTTMAMETTPMTTAKETTNAPSPTTTMATDAWTTMTVATTTQTAATTTAMETTPMTTAKETTNAPSPTTAMATDAWTTMTVATTTQTPTTTTAMETTPRTTAKKTTNAPSATTTMAANVRTTMKAATSTKTAKTTTPMKTAPMTTTKKTTKPPLIPNSGHAASSSSSVLQKHGRFLLMVMCLSLVGVLLATVGLLLLKRWKKNKNFRPATDMSGTEMPAITTHKFTPIPTCESSSD